MEWVETTAKTVEEARDAALDQLGVHADEAEFDVLEEPRPGLFGRLRGEARVRARVKPAPVRPKRDRRRRSRGDKRPAGSSGDGDGEAAASSVTTDDGSDAGADTGSDAGSDTGADVAAAAAEKAGNGSGRDERPAAEQKTKPKKQESTRGGRSRSSGPRRQEKPMNDDDRPVSEVSPDEVGAAARSFMEGLTEAFGQQATTTLDVDGTELEVSVDGAELGLLIGPGGRTLTAIQDLARVASQRRLGDHETRLRVDVAGYRERRQVALTRFAREVADSVRESGTPRSLEPMTSADRKIIHDVLNEESGVTSRSEGDDPDRRIVVEPT